MKNRTGRKRRRRRKKEGEENKHACLYYFIWYSVDNAFILFWLNDRHLFWLLPNMEKSIGPEDIVH